MAFLGTFDTREKSVGQELSKGLGTGLTKALDKLAQSKLQEIERQRIAQGLQGIGFEEQEAKGISQLPGDIQKDVVREQFLQEREGRKASQKTVHDIVNAEKAAKDNLAALNRIEELDRKGNVQGITGNILKRVGLGQFRNADTQELEKLTVSFLGNLKNVFGARPTQFDVQQYLNGLPTTLQSAEGRARVIKNLRAFNEASKLRADALRDILKANKNRVPGNLDLLIEEKIGPQLDALHAQIGGSEGGTSSTFDQLPDPAQYAGKRIRDTNTGQILQSNGSQWVPVG